MNVKNKLRFDDYLVKYKFANSRHQAVDLIKRGQVKLNDKIITKPALQVDIFKRQRIKLISQPYVSRAGYKLEAALKSLNINLKNKIIFDVGAHKGGFSECCLRLGVKQIIAVDVGSQTLDAKLLQNSKMLAFYKVDIRDFNWPQNINLPDLIIIDLSFISLKNYLNGLKKFMTPSCQVLILVKPQFETEQKLLQKGVIKNDYNRRLVLNNIETWFKDNRWLLKAKTNASITGLRGNLERFYLLEKVI